MVASGRAPHEVDGHGGARETDPDGRGGRRSRAALRETGRAADGRARSRWRASSTGSWCLDAAAAPLRPAMLWNDTRSAPRTPPRSSTSSAPAALGGAPSAWCPCASFTVTRGPGCAAHGARRSPRRRARDPAAARLPHRAPLRARPPRTAATRRAPAGGRRAPEDYSDEVLGRCRRARPRRCCRPCSGPRDAAGRGVGRAAAERSGCPPASPSAAGTGDNMARRARARRRGRATPVISLGTSGTAYAAIRAPRRSTRRGVDRRLRGRGGRLPAAGLHAQLPRSRSTAWPRWLGLERDAVEPGGEVVVLPYLDGERTPNLPHAAGTIAGLRHDTDARADPAGRRTRARSAALLDALEPLDAGSAPALDRRRPAAC